MGSLYSMPYAIVRGELIYSVDKSFVIFYPDLKKDKLDVFVFDEDIRNKCYQMFKEIMYTKKDIKVYHNKSVIKVIKSEKTSYSSKDSSPTTFGWISDPVANNQLL